MTDAVADNEWLFRSIDRDPAKKHFAVAAGGLVVSSAAFLDPGYKPSVDRAALCADRPEHTQRAEGDGVVRLFTRRVRDIDPAEVGDRDQKGHVQQLRRVDVVPDPIGEGEAAGGRPNPAHALVVTTPQIAKNNSAWGRVRVALARVATEGGWAIRPDS